VIFTGNIASLLEPKIRVITGKGLRRRPDEYPAFLHVGSSKKNKETTLEMTGLPSAPERGQNDPIATFDLIVGSEKTHVHKSYAIGIEYSWESQDDELYGVLPAVARQLGESVAETREIEAAKVLNNGFPTGGTVVTYKGETLINTAHPKLGAGAAQTNAFAGDLGLGALQTAIINFDALEDDQGKKMRARPVKLFYDPQNQFLVEELLKSEGKPFTANNEVNAIRGMLQPMKLHYLTDSSSWFIKGDLGEEFDLRYFNRTPPSMRSFDDERTKSSIFTVATRFVASADAWQNIFGGRTTL